MKILLMGEFSGFYLNLKQGLQELGAEVTLAANGDGNRFRARICPCFLREKPLHR